MLKNICTTGDLRRNLVKAMVDLRSGAISAKEARPLITLARKTTAALQRRIRTEVNDLKKTSD